MHVLLKFSQLTEFECILTFTSFLLSFSPLLSSPIQPPLLLSPLPSSALFSPPPLFPSPELASRAPISCIRCHKLRTNSRFKCGRCGEVYLTKPIVDSGKPGEEDLALSQLSAWKRRKEARDTQENGGAVTLQGDSEETGKFCRHTPQLHVLL